MQLSWQVFSFRHLQLCPLRPNHSYDKGKKLLVPAITCNKLELIQKWRFCYKFKSDKKTNYSFKSTHKTMCYFPSLQFFSGEVRLCVDHLDCKIKRGDAWENHASYTKLSRGTSAVLSWYWNRETNVGSAPTKKGQNGKWSWEVKRSNMFEQVKKEKRKPKKLSSWQHLREMSCRWKFFDGYDQWFIFGRQIGESWIPGLMIGVAKILKHRLMTTRPRSNSAAMVTEKLLFTGVASMSNSKYRQMRLRGS